MYKNREDREKIKQRLDFNRRLHRAGKEIIDDYQFYEKVAKKYSLDNTTLNIKISLFLRRRKYLQEQPRFEKAIDDIVFKNKTLQNAAKENKVDEKKLLEEYTKCKSLKNMTEYKYDLLSETNGIFTFTEEFSLLERLHCWEKECECPCQICALEQLLSFAFDLAQQTNKQYPETWMKHKRADLIWLHNFLMKYIEEMSKFEPNICKYKIKCQLLAKQSSSLAKQEMLQSSTSYAHIQGDIKPSQSSNVSKKSDIKKKRLSV